MVNSNSQLPHHDNSVTDSNTDGELMSSSGSDELQRQFSASSGDGLSDKEDVLEAVKSQVRHKCIFVCVNSQQWRNGLTAMIVNSRY